MQGSHGPVRRRFLRGAYQHLGELGDIEIAGSIVGPQRNTWSCGPWALRYCLLKWGLDVDPYELIKLSGTTRVGSTCFQLEAAARSSGSECEHFDERTAAVTKATVQRLLKRGLPLILSVDDDGHWVACLHRSHRGYLIFDSSRPGPVVSLWGWADLRRRMRCTDKHDTVHYMFTSVSRPVQRRSLGV